MVLGIIGFTWYAVVPAVYGPIMLSSHAGKAFGATILVLVFSALVSSEQTVSMPASARPRESSQQLTQGFCTSLALIMDFVAVLSVL